ncbi:hypothetical protein P3T75_00725 [Enterococcus montenegrensis]|uniref:hypothetical protein n=1 Tax=Enterococcus montenegrensis TaxID=3031993 RepID=UPI00249F63E1|nr:hypothetical protein [Enterococcus montenegrensis]WHA09397.1 hypothetical protein P3T75_00725 [Enterococcus montenegrensis]
MNKRATEFEKWLRLTEQAKSNKAEVIGKGISKLNIQVKQKLIFTSWILKKR